jgi:ribosome-binding protein aMBF1 (putative translation factor)
MLRITQERERRGWSRTELARRARMQPGDVGKIEARRLRAYPGQAERLARVLKLTVEELFEEVETAPHRGAVA